MLEKNISKEGYQPSVSSSPKLPKGETGVVSPLGSGGGQKLLKKNLVSELLLEFATLAVELKVATDAKNSPRINKVQKEMLSIRERILKNID